MVIFEEYKSNLQRNYCIILTIYASYCTRDFQLGSVAMTPKARIYMCLLQPATKLCYNGIPVLVDGEILRYR